MSETSLTIEKIQIWKCKDCGKIEPTRSFVCTDCHSRNSEIGFIDSTGIVVASTIIRRPAAGQILRANMSLRCKTRSGRSCLGSFLPARDCVFWVSRFCF